MPETWNAYEYALSLCADEILIRMPDNSVWAVPVAAVALDRAVHYADEFDNDVRRSLDEDTLPLFSAHSEDVEDWRRNNMNWSDVARFARRVSDPPALSDGGKQEAWVNGPSKIIAGKHTGDSVLPCLWEDWDA